MCLCAYVSWLKHHWSFAFCVSVGFLLLEFGWSHSWVSGFIYCLKEGQSWLVPHFFCCCSNSLTFIYFHIFNCSLSASWSLLSLSPVLVHLLLPIPALSLHNSSSLHPLLSPPPSPPPSLSFLPQIRYRKDKVQSKLTPTFPLVYAVKDLSNGCAIASVLHYYCSNLLPLEGTHTQIHTRNTYAHAYKYI